MATPNHHIKSISKTFAILAELERNGGTGVTEIARQTDIPKSSVYKYLATLKSLGFVTKKGNQYVLSFRFFQLGIRIRERCTVYQYARSRIDRLAEEIGETVSLIVEENGDAVYLYQMRTTEAPRGPVGEGGRIPIHVPAAGKAILSYRPLDEVETYLEGAEVSPSVTGLLDELERIRDQRLIIDRDGPNDGEYSAGLLQGHRHVVSRDRSDDSLHSIAVPIRNTDDYAVAALEVSGSASALDGGRVEDIATLLVEAGGAIETDILD